MILVSSVSLLLLSNCQLNKEMKAGIQPVLDEATFYLPAEEAIHEGTWLQWPHNYTYRRHHQRHDETFIAMAKALHTGEKVHIVVYNEKEENRVEELLIDADLDMGQIDFFQ